MSGDDALVEAFLVLFHLNDGSERGAGVDAAAEVVYAALRGLRLRLDPGVTADEHDDAVNHVMWRLVDGARRSNLSDPPSTPGRVRSYLRDALYHAVLDARRKRRHEQCADVSEALPDGSLLPEEAIAEDEAVRERRDALRELEAYLFEEFIPRRGGRAAATKRQCFEEMIAVARGAITLDDLHRAALEPGERSPDGGALARAAERIYKAHRRALKWAHREVQATRADHAGDARLDALDRLLRELARRRLDEGTQPHLSDPGAGRRLQGTSGTTRGARR